jgi:hypothetical protein
MLQEPGLRYYLEVVSKLDMTEPRITRLPSQATNGNDYGRRPARPPALSDRQQREEYAREAYLIDGWQDERPRI